MASQAWLESSLRRSASLGLEVLERASRRSVDWTSTDASRTPTLTDADAHVPVKRRHKELNDAFATIAEFMAQTTYHCKRFYESGCCTEPSDIERTHTSRFHSRPAPRRTTSARPARKHGRVSAAGEDFYIEVSPGTYAITASLPEAHQQTQLVTIKPGESIDLTFNL
ncbi:A-kinase-interacting protein 1 [Parambassis ranga]|uniref:A-kinase-interacting protein 1 n=1 Tax=Parambassis ranga TaxID=210632 RepID=A0A6P7KI40_9TELE|nr:A-kinase-interacting protein 1 [Parambassis ranga]XP_028287046.1 A-kinase-interacting protein 1 [Parambassis ranga]